MRLVSNLTAIEKACSVVHSWLRGRRTKKAKPSRRRQLPWFEVLEDRSLLSASSSQSLLTAYGQQSMSFEPNQGQTCASVQFLSRGSGYTLFLGGDAAELSLHTASDASGASAALSVQLVGANINPTVAGMEPLQGKSNYLSGNDPSQWRTNIPTFAKVKYQDVYQGVGLIYYGNQGQLEYDFTVAAGADPGLISLNFQGGGSPSLDAQGNLVLHTAIGDVVERAPVLYQEIDGVRQAIDGGYILQGDHQVGFHVGAYDHSRQLVIDPILLYSTYFGGAGNDFGTAIAVDADGDAYVTGSTESTKLPAPLDPASQPFQSEFNGFGNDAFVVKLDPQGNVLWTTYLGGNPDESNVKPLPPPYVGNNGYEFAANEGTAIAVDPETDVYVAGYTLITASGPLGGSPGFMPMVNSFQSSPTQFGPNGFVAELDPSGSALIYSSYLGTTYYIPSGIAADADGNAYVTGSYPKIPYTDLSTIDDLINNNDGFVAKIASPSPSSGKASIVYQVSLGNPSLDGSNTWSNAIAVDDAGQAYVAGSSNAPDFANNEPTNPSQNGALTLGGYDAYLAKLDAGGNLVFADRLGGELDDWADGIAVDAAGNIDIAGGTLSLSFPVVNAIQDVRPKKAAEDSTAFVAKVNATGNSLLFSTYLGGDGRDEATAIAVDASGHAYVTGLTASSNFPTSNAWQKSQLGYAADSLQNVIGGNAFVAKIDTAGGALFYSSYLGGGHPNIPFPADLSNATNYSDFGAGIAVDQFGNAYVTGSTPSTTFPTTANAAQQQSGGGTSFNGTPATDAFVAKIANNLIVTALPVNAVLGEAYSAPVATFTAPDPMAPGSDFTAQINWGDGTIDAVTPQKSGDPERRFWLPAITSTPSWGRIRSS